MHPIPLPHFLLLILAVVLAGGLSLWGATRLGLPLEALGLVALGAVGLWRLVARVE